MAYGGRMLAIPADAAKKLCMAWAGRAKARPSASRLRSVERAPHLGFRSHIKPIKFVDSAGKNLSQQAHGMQLATVR